MARTKMIARIVADQRCQAARVAAGAAKKPGPSNQRRRRQPKRIGFKNFEGRICGRSFTIRRLLAQQRNTDVKNNGVVVHKMVCEREQCSQQKLEGHIMKIM